MIQLLKMIGERVEAVKAFKSDAAPPEQRAQLRQLKNSEKLRIIKENDYLEIQFFYFKSNDQAFIRQVLSLSEEVMQRINPEFGRLLEACRVREHKATLKLLIGVYQLFIDRAKLQPSQGTLFAQQYENMSQSIYFFNFQVRVLINFTRKQLQDLLQKDVQDFPKINIVRVKSLRKAPEVSADHSSTSSLKEEDEPPGFNADILRLASSDKFIKKVINNTENKDLSQCQAMPKRMSHHERDSEDKATRESILRLNHLIVIFLKRYYVIHDLDIYTQFYLFKTFRNSKPYQESLYFRRICKNTEVNATQQNYLRYYRRHQADFTRLHQHAANRKKALFKTSPPATSQPYIPKKQERLKLEVPSLKKHHSQNKESKSFLKIPKLHSSAQSQAEAMFKSQVSQAQPTLKTYFVAPEREPPRPGPVDSLCFTAQGTNSFLNQKQDDIFKQTINSLNQLRLKGSPQPAYHRKSRASEKIGRSHQVLPSRMPTQVTLPPARPRKCYLDFRLEDAQHTEEYLFNYQPQQMVRIQRLLNGPVQQVH